MKESNLMFNPKVSVIVNCFNGEKYLSEALDSVISQSYPNWELIFWDNQSKDASAEIVKSIDDPRIHYFYAEEHTNLGEARSRALAKAKGEWVCFLDVDDIWSGDKLYCQLLALQQSEDDVGFIYSKCAYFFDDNRYGRDDRKYKVFPSCDLPVSDLTSQLCRGNFIPFPSLMFNVQAILHLGSISLYRFSPDYYMTLELSSKFNCIAVDDVLCGYRMHSESMSSGMKETGIIESIDLVKKYESYCSKRIFLFNHNVRYIVFLLRSGRLSRSLNQIKQIGIGMFLFSLLDMVKYYVRYRYSGKGSTSPIFLQD